MSPDPKRNISAVDHRSELDSPRPHKYSRGESWRPSPVRGKQSQQSRSERWNSSMGDRSRKRQYDATEETIHHGDARRPAGKKFKKGSRGDDGAETKGLSDKIHSLRRLLGKATDLPADIYQEKERELQGYIAEQQIRKVKKENRALTSRYHFVRFLERKRANRHLKHINKNFQSWKSGNGNELSVCNKSDVSDQAHQSKQARIEHRESQERDYDRKLHEAQVDLNYTLYAPLDQKYISLYPSGANGKKAGVNDPDASRQRHDHEVDEDRAGLMRNESGQKPPLWIEVERAMKSGTLEALRDGKTLTAKPLQDRSLAVRNGTEPSAKKARETEPGSGNKDEMSEDDFFER